MRPALRWALAGAAISAAAVTWLPHDDDLPITDTPTSMGTAPAPRVDPARGAVAPPRPVAEGNPMPRRSATPGGLGSTSAEPAIEARKPWPRMATAALAAWTPPPPALRPAANPQAASEPAPAPPPAFPYRWIGQLEENGSLRVFVADAQRLWSLAPGETLGSSWRIDGVAAEQLQLTWLPTGAAVTVAARP